MLAGADKKRHARPAPIIDLQLQRGISLDIGPCCNVRLIAIGFLRLGAAAAGAILTPQRLRNIRGRHRGENLGLAISQRLIRIMGGEISVTSEAGKGSTFTLSLPGKLVNPSASAVSTPVQNPVFVAGVDA